MQVFEETFHIIKDGRAGVSARIYNREKHGPILRTVKTGDCIRASLAPAAPPAVPPPPAPVSPRATPPRATSKPVHADELDPLERALAEAGGGLERHGGDPIDACLAEARAEVDRE